jgi:hydroxylamine reductase
MKLAVEAAGGKMEEQLHESAIWYSNNQDEINAKAEAVNGKIDAPDEDTRSLRALVLYGLKGLTAYQEHAFQLGHKSDALNAFVQNTLVALTNDDLTLEENIALVMETGKYGVDVMALLDEANTKRYGNPEITTVNLGVSDKPGILISGHDLRDMEDLLKQTDGTGVDVYTHSEMLPAHYYPEFKKYKHFVGNYGNAWWKQNEEFESFNGPVLFTTNCIVPPKKSNGYSNRVYTTGVSGFPGFKHVADRKNGGMKDFSEIIEHAKKCKSPVEIETGEIVGGFAHNQVLQLADKVVDAVKSGAIRKFFVMAGCDGRMKDRSYYTEFAEKLPTDTVILTAGCAKYRYNKLPLGDIGGIPRVLDAGQCNDSYSLAVIALKLKEVFELNDINDLPIAYNIAWYEQKAVIVLLALLYLGVKDIHLGPTLPAFLSPNVAKVLVENFGIAGINTVDEDMKLFLN